MKAQVLKIGVLLMLLAVIISCSKKNTPAPVSNKKLSYQFKVLNANVALSSSTPGSNTTALGTGSINWQSGFANILSISFIGNNIDNNVNPNDTTIDTNDSFVEPSIYKVDLFGSNQLLGNVDIAKGTYHDAEIKVELKSSATEPALYLKGVYASANGNVPIELSLSEGGEQMEVIATAKNLTVSSKDSYVAFINMHLDKLMAGVTTGDLDAATLSNGSILIDQSNNTSIYDKIMANINGFSDGDYNADN
ncbi:MAG TPA: hypothetical protein VNW95_12530 [Mucilaginibacter sp.]|jgi:hypothetical protein|nr:hypothetical protein [Mucilaginibacter sp.]